MDNEEQPPHINHGSSLHLPQFWAENSELWFSTAEPRFCLWNTEDEQVKFDLVVNALPKECLRTVLDLVTNPPEEDANKASKERLSDHHNLTEFQLVQKIHAMEALSGRKPSELLHEMLELCPSGHEASPFFLFLFLQHLPSFLRNMLGEDNYDNIRAVAVKADRLWAIHAHQQHSTVTAVKPSPAEPAAITAVKGGGHSKPGGGGSRCGKGHGKASSSRQPAALNPAASPIESQMSSLSRVQAGLLLPLELQGEGHQVRRPVQLGRKLAYRGFLNAVTPSRLVHGLDQISNRRFRVDTGESYFIFPHSSSSLPPDPLLAGPSGSSIPCWREESTFSFSGRLFKWTLLLVVKFPILDVDFLRHHRLLVDPAENQLISTTGSSCSSHPSPVVSLVVAVPCSLAASSSAPPAPPSIVEASPAVSAGSSLSPASAAAVKTPFGSAAAALSVCGLPPSSSPADTDPSIPFAVWLMIFCWR
jgi:hypothetical protein